ncbi:MAG TPA: 50S ribosomal protein L11 methyltransferase [Alphaproteobacteria bacterium]|nr:50S ribosomal protein L11 methyltransferase [Alphaproteobacteria bacterium]
MHSRPWVVELEVPKAGGEVFADLFAGLSESFSCFETEDGALWRFAAYLERKPDRAALVARSALVAAALGLAPPEVALRRLPARDWASENRRQFPPVSAGRFFIHGSFFGGAKPPGRIVLSLDAGLAFGSGTHESTRGCLLAIDRLARRRRFRAPLDLGCGSGILGLAMARLWRRPVVAADSDSVAVEVARANARRNGLAAFVHVHRSDGLRARGLGKRRRYDLILANILARPLERLAPSFARARRPGGVIVLSGILEHQVPGVLAAYRAERLALERRIELGDWVTLIVRERGPRRSR